MASIYDIAKAAGVSTATVSLIMNHKGDDLRIAQKTQERVRQVAKELGYVPNVNARKLISRQLKNVPEVGLFWSPTQHPVFLNTLMSKMIEMKNQKSIEDMNVTIYPFENEHINKLDKILSGNFVHGLIIPVADKKDMDYLEQLDIHVPVVIIYQETGKYYAVDVDNEKNGRIACEIFHDLGYKYVGVVENAYSSVSSQKRMEGFRRRCKELGIEIVTQGGLERGIHEKDTSFMNHFVYGKEYIEQSIAEGRRPQGIFAQDDDTARGVIAGLKKHGFQVPEDMAVLCYGLNSNENQENSSLTMITYPIEEFTEKIWSLMNQLIHGGEWKERRILCDSPVYFGKSCPQPPDFKGKIIK